MPFGTASPLRKLPDGIDPRQRIFYDAIRYTGRMISIAYGRLHRDLVMASQALITTGAVGAEFEPIFLDAWSVVDSVHRFSQLIHNARGIKQRTPTMRIFENRINGIEDLRNGVQHLNGTINDLIKENMPAMGVLSWVYMPDPKTAQCWICTLLPGSIVKSGGHHMMNPAGRESIAIPIDHVEISAFGHTVNLSMVNRAVEKLGDSLEEEIEVQIKDRPNLGSDAAIVAKIKLDGELRKVEK